MTKYKITPAIVEKAQAGDQQAMVTIMDGLSPKINKTIKSLTVTGLEWDDLWQAGRLAIMEALESFDADRDIHFVAYAQNYIKGYIYRAASAQAPAGPKVPDNLRLAVIGTGGMTSEEKIDFIVSTGKATNRDTAVAALSANNVLSADQLMGWGARDSSTDQMGDSMGEDRAPWEPTSTVAQDAPMPDLDLAIAKDLLTDKEADVLGLLFGLKGYEPATTSEIAEALGISVRAVNKRKESGLARLKEALQTDPDSKYYTGGK